MPDENKEYAEMLQKEGVEVEGVPQKDAPADSEKGEFDDVNDDWEKELETSNPDDSKETEKGDDDDPKEDPDEDTKEDKKSETDESKEDTSTLKDRKEDKEPRKRSIYDEYRDKKSELKEEREKREAAEKRANELEEQLAGKKPVTEENKSEIDDKITEFAKEIDADPAVLKKMKDIILEGHKSTGLDDETKQALEAFKQEQEKNNQLSEKQAFQEELNGLKPQLKEVFPNASEEEMAKVHKKIDELAHSKDYHDKDLDYVLFKEKSTLSTLVSPKKRGLESTDPTDAIPDEATEFDPNADITKMSPKQLEKWEKEYDKNTSSDDELLDDGRGNKILL